MLAMLVFNSIKTLIYMVLLLLQGRPYIFLIVEGNYIEPMRKPSPSYGYCMFPSAKLSAAVRFFILLPCLKRNSNGNTGMCKHQSSVLPHPLYSPHLLSFSAVRTVYCSSSETLFTAFKSLAEFPGSFSLYFCCENFSWSG